MFMEGAMQDTFYGEYPTEKFPSEYTKQGQAVLMQKFLNGQKDTSTPNKTSIVEMQSIEQPQPEKPVEHSPTSSLDIHKLMPLIKSMSQNKSVSKTELMKMMLPMLSNNNGDLNELISLMIDKKQQEKDVLDLTFEENASKPKIASFKRVE